MASLGLSELSILYLKLLLGFSRFNNWIVLATYAEIDGKITVISFSYLECSVKIGQATQEFGDPL